MSFARQLQLFNANQQRQQRLAQNDNFTRLQDRLYEDQDDDQSQHLYQSESEEIEENTEETDDDNEDQDDTEYTDDNQSIPTESSVSSPSIWYSARDLFIIFFLLGVALLVIFLSIYVIPKSTTSTSTSSVAHSSSSSTGTFIILPSGPVTSITDRSIISPQVFYNTSTYLTYPSVFSINYNFSNQQFNDYSSNSLPITQTSPSVCRDTTRGGVLCNSSIQMTPSASSLTSWTLSFWISSPPNNNHTNFTIIEYF